MANTIGVFTRDGEGSFVGSVTTLALSFPVKLSRAERTSEDGPDYRAYSGAVELGAGWTRTAKTSGNDYISVRLDDPSFAAPLFASLFKQDDGTHHLVWDRR